MRICGGFRDVRAHTSFQTQCTSNRVRTRCRVYKKPTTPFSKSHTFARRGLAGRTTPQILSNGRNVQFNVHGDAPVIYLAEEIRGTTRGPRSIDTPNVRCSANFDRGEGHRQNDSIVGARSPWSIGSVLHSDETSLKVRSRPIPVPIVGAEILIVDLDMKNG